MKLLRYFLFILLFFGTPAHADDLVSVSAVSRQQNDLTEVLIEFDIKLGWHIFSPYEQEFGEPLKIRFELPSTIEVIEQSFSRPQRFDQSDFSFDGYENKAFYKTTMKSSDNLFPLKAVLSWQACSKDECYPQKQTILIQKTDEKLFAKKLSTATDYFISKYQSSYWIKLVTTLASAFLGGLILNLMPCIFPVLSLKLVSLLKLDDETRFFEALFYSLGVILSMTVLALILFIIRLFYPLVGWGFQMQSPVFVTLMLLLFVFLTLTMLDLIQIDNSFLGKLAFLRAKNKRTDAFLTGLLAVLIASPCSAPFMGAAIGYALISPSYIYFPMFFCLGVGYALPFAILATYPKFLRKLLPKPGRWMSALKKILSLPLILTCLWLVWILCAQLGWIVSGKNLQWHPYSKQAVSQALKRKQPVFIDFTAKWCLTCLVNKQTTLESDTLAQLVKQHHILLLRADATNHEVDVAEGLNLYGRASVPLYIYYDGKSEDYLTLPQVLTPDILQEYLK